jgi:hypothetical protein
LQKTISNSDKYENEERKRSKENNKKKLKDNLRKKMKEKE